MLHVVAGSLNGLPGTHEDNDRFNIGYFILWFPKTRAYWQPKTYKG
jgi:hypothetical protein